MNKRSIWRTLQKSIILSLIFLLASEPVWVAAKPLQADPKQEAIDSLTASGDVYLTNVAETLSLSTGLMNSVSAIQSTPLSQISESAIAQTRADALKAAEASAVALGSVDDVATSIESLGSNLPSAIDPLQIASEGLPQQLHDALVQQAGLTSADVDAISGGMDDMLLARQGMDTSGMPAEIAAQLTQAGFTQAEIDQIATVAGTRGLADPSLTTSLAQFRASQDEWANTRTQMLILNMQLMGYQIGVRQANGVEPRAATEAELQEIAQDELRLLVHVAHLQELWGSDPNLEIGEGDWWFIEHYAGRAVERLDALVIESQNRALIADLFVLQEMKLLALSARNGDANYVKAELDGLGEVLSYLVGDRTFISRQRDELKGFAYVAARLASHPKLREHIQWSVDQKTTSGAAKLARLRMDAIGVQNLAPQFGVIAEQNEANNIKTLLFMAGLPYFDQLSADITQAAISIISQVTPENVVIWITAILTGDTDNPALIAANVGFSLIPIFGAIPDIYSLVADPSIFVKALSVFGIVGSLGDLVALIPFMQGIGGASFLADASVAVIKALFKNADTVFQAMLNGLKLTEAFDVLIDFLKVTGHYIGDSIGHNLEEAIQFLESLFTGGFKLWDNFVAFVKRVGAETLLIMGFDKGSLLVGRILSLGIDLSDDALLALKQVADDLTAAGVDLSDEAAEGLGRAAKSLGGTEVQRLISSLGNPELVKKVLTSYKRFDDATLVATGKLAQKVNSDDFVALLTKYASNPDDLTHVKSVFNGLEKVIANPKYKAQAIDLAKSASEVDIPKLGKYFDEISSIDLALVEIRQGFEASKIAQTENVNIYIAGRLADTPEEKLFRENVAYEANYILSLYKDGNTPLPEWARQFDNEAIFAANNVTRHDFLEFVAQYETSAYYQVAKGYNIEWYQVKVSTGELEVDAFIEGIGQNEVQIQTFKDFLVPAFDVPKADIYNEKKYLPWMEDRQTSIPWANVPAGSIKFGADGSILHELLP